MQAFQCTHLGPPDELELNTLPDPTPAAGEVIIEVHAAPLNFPDVLMIEGKYQMRPELPFTPGAEVAGIVTAVGEGVTHLKVGDRVASFVQLGGFAQQAVAPANATFPLPNGVDFAEGAALPLAYGTSAHALLDRAELKAGQTLLVLGAAGGVGLAAVQIGKALGARVIAAASTDEKLELCRQNGADDTINYSTQDLRSALKELTGGKGPDVIYDPVGGKLAEPAFRSIAWGGKYLVVGFAEGEIPALPLNLALLKGASIVGVFWGEFAKRDPKKNLANLHQLLTWMGEGKVKPYISARYALADVPQALKDMAGRKVTGKAVIEPQR
ncbi:NADPH:quinone oxidoreductase family protein [Deinococcus psychrotolerans]|uniref:NADPH:quinone oxidoreductase family protein n=1 Tax=Deinococcus psychrotolerans TaxID=2489213 RepID=A0A3G8YA47_9DEIO|nr:NADPH:quinone oxidoreductase family protein [Deinococcus psychrotolerans]AZI42249.1 NADPH:quinone oxidoreductase family protein [Deinococcus psychrotolerans]